MLSQTAPRDRTSRSTTEDLVLTTIKDHAEALLRTVLADFNKLFAEDVAKYREATKNVTLFAEEPPL